MISSSEMGACARAQQIEDNNIGNCGRVWHIGFFFDGVGRNIELDVSSGRLTNIARLFLTFPNSDKNTDNKCYNKFYFSGLGTSYAYTPNDEKQSFIDNMMDNIQDAIKDLPEDKASGAVEDILIKKVSWTDVLWNFADELVNPVEWVKEATGIVYDAAKKTLIESTPWLRDSHMMSENFMTGVPTRVDAAKEQFKQYYDKNRSEENIPIKMISISLFGFDLGATLARKFLDEFLEKVCNKSNDGTYWYKDSLVDIVFAGFFDCSRHTPASSNNGLNYFFSCIGKIKSPASILGNLGVFFGEKAIDQDSYLPGSVKNALHLIAAHERRPWRGLYMLGNVKDNGKCMREEQLLPGSSEDIGGGMLPDEQKPSAELCRVALYHMYDAASRAGVPLPDFETLNKTDPEIARYYLMDDAVKGNSANHWAKLYQSDVHAQIFSPEAQEKHLDNYFLWLGEQYYMYQCVLIQLNDELLKVSSESVSGMFNVLTPEGREKVQFLHNKINELKTLWGWLDDVKSVAIGLKNDFIVSPHPNDSRMLLWANVYEPAVKRAVCFLDFFHRAYKGEPLPDKRVSVSANIIYSYFMHDIQKVEVNASITEDFFLRRSAEIPEAKSED